MPQFKPRRGLAAVEEAASRKGGSSNFRPFVPEIFWSDDGDKKYILVLSDFEGDDENPSPNSVVVADLHEFIQVGVWEKNDGSSKPKYETFVSRKDPLAGSEDYDDIEDRLGRKPKTRCLGVAVELEPVFEEVKGRKRPVSFTVATDTFTRKTDNGDEEMTQPLIGIISQSSYLMWSPLSSFDESQGPLSELPLEITRRGSKADTRYDFVPFEGRSVDLQPLFDHLDGVSYLRDDIEEIEAAWTSVEESAEDDDNLEVQKAQVVAQHLLDKRLTELADKDRYDELIKPIEDLPAPSWGGGNSGRKSSGSGSSRPAARPARTSPREAPKAKPDSSSDAEARFEKLKAKFETS